MRRKLSCMLSLVLVCSLFVVCDRDRPVEPPTEEVTEPPDPATSLYKKDPVRRTAALQCTKNPAAEFTQRPGSDVQTYIRQRATSRCWGQWTAFPTVSLADLVICRAP
jgi:hypothetical protein